MASDLTYTVDDAGAYTFTGSGHRYRVRRSGRGLPVVTLEHDASILVTDRLDLGADTTHAVLGFNLFLHTLARATLVPTYQVD